MLTNKRDMINFISDFYRKLYAEVPSDPAISEYFLNNRPKLSEEESNLCEGRFNLEELLFAIKSSKGGTSPGVDGLPIEFYKIFSSLIGPRLVDVFNSMLGGGQLGRDQNCAVIVILCKKIEAAEKLKNWRPISLLCNGLKLITKSVRLGNVMNILIGEFQTGEFQTSGVKGRQIFSNVHLIRNIAEYLNRKGKSAALLSMDQSKAFDRVSHEFLFQTLTFSGFGPHFISWIHLLYLQPFLRVSVNGELTNNISVKRSLRQGCSLSPLLYVLVIDSLLRRINDSDSIRGIKLPGGKEVKISAFADDTNFFCETPHHIRRILLFFELFGLASGSLVNFDKSFIIFLGPWKPKEDSFCGISVAREPVKIFGIYFDQGGISKTTFEILKTKLQERADELKGRCQTLRGRASLFHALVASKLWYVATVCVIPKKFIKSYTLIMFRFIWGGSVLERIKRDTLYLEKGKGGLEVIDLDRKIKALSIKHVGNLLKREGNDWEYLALYWMKLKLITLGLMPTDNSTLASWSMPSFYKTAIDNVIFFKKIVDFPLDSDILQAVPVKGIYLFLVKTRAVTFPTAWSLHPHIRFDLSWRNLNLVKHYDYDYNVHYLVSHGVLHTKSYLASHHIDVPDQCVWCSQSETTEHIFYFCDNVQLCREWLQETLSDTTRTVVFLEDDFVFSLFEHKNKFFKMLLLTTTYTLKAHIWRARNRAYYFGHQTSETGLLAGFKQKLRERIRYDFNRLPEPVFHNIWIAFGGFVKINDQDIKYLF